MSDSLVYLRPHTASTAAPSIDSNFPGGNILVDKIAPDELFVRPDLRDTVGPWFYWAFRVKNAGGRTLTFQFTENEPLTVRGAAVNLGAGWFWTAGTSSKSFTYTFPADANAATFALAPMYTPGDFRAFMGTVDGTLVRETALCRSAGGRDVPLLRIGNSENPRFKVLVTARHHACETMGSFVLEGMLSAVLGKTETGEWLRENVEMLVVPMMDLEGVEKGDQGKNRPPRDHNRDYGEEPIYGETRALKALAVTWARKVPVVAMDLHCPWIRGHRNEVIYQVGNSEGRIWEEQKRFGEVLERVVQEGAAPGALPYSSGDDLAFGLEWNVAAGFTAGVSFGRWAPGLPGVKLVTTLEVPYANAGGAEVLPGSARGFGERLARGLAGYLGGAT
jgi:hypothetical protein